MRETTLFEDFVVWLVRNCAEIHITTGLAFGHKIYTKGKYRFIERDENLVIVESDDFSYQATSLEELARFVRAISAPRKEN